MSNLIKNYVFIIRWVTCICKFIWRYQTTLYTQHSTYQWSQAFILTVKRAGSSLRFSTSFHCRFCCIVSPCAGVHKSCLDILLWPIVGLVWWAAVWSWSLVSIPLFCSSCITITHGSRRRPERTCTVPGAHWTAVSSTASSSTSSSRTAALSSTMW